MLMLLTKAVPALRLNLTAGHLSYLACTSAYYHCGVAAQYKILDVPRQARQLKCSHLVVLRVAVHILIRHVGTALDGVVT